MNSNRLQLIYIIATCVLALAAIGSWKVGCEALDRSDSATTTAQNAVTAAQKANTIAEKAYNMTLQTNLPLITTYLSEINKFSDDWTETMIVTDDLGKIGTSEAYAYFLMQVEIAGKTVQIPIDGYFSNSNPTFAKEGLLYTFSYKGNYLKYLKIYGDFKEAARNDGYTPSISEQRMLYIRYSAAALGDEDTQNRFEKFFRVYETIYPLPISNEDGFKILNAIIQSRNLAENESLDLYIGELNGVDLWNWFKNAFLQ